MSRATMVFDLQWALKYLDDLERFIKLNQMFMAKNTVQRVRELFETYGRQGKETLFIRLDEIEISINRGEDPSSTISTLKSDISSWMRNI